MIVGIKKIIILVKIISIDYPQPSFSTLLTMLMAIKKLMSCKNGKWPDYIYLPTKFWSE